MSLKKTNDNKGSYRGAGAYSRDYARFNGYRDDGFPARDIYNKIEGVGDYETDRAFTGQVSRSDNHPSNGRYSTRGEGAYTRDGRRLTERARKQSDGPRSGGQKVSD